jgi:glycosyltransferase involved in cell wall biosynthesis
VAERDLSESYAEQYYKGYYQRSPKWFTFFGHIADVIVEKFEPRTHLDAGCAWGFLVEVLRERGVESFGIDFSLYAIDRVHPDIRQYCRRASLTEPIAGGPYDLVTCIEVLEHMEEADALRAIDNLTALTDVILFSSTPYDFEDPTHINVQPLLYWLRAFAQRGFYPAAESDAGFVAEHAFIVRKTSPPEPESALQMFARIVELRAESRRLASRLETDVEKHRADELEAQLREASDTLDEIRTSPGWQVINRYRAWRGTLHTRRPGLLRTWERAAGLALKRFKQAELTDAAPTSARWDYAEWIAQNEPRVDGLAAQAGLANALAYRPRISVVMPVYKISAEILEAAIDSLQAQTYDNWELCASVIPSLNPAAAALLQERSQEDSRIRIRSLESNLGISGNSFEALEAASGQFIALLDHDDTLAPFALYEVALLLNEDPAANFIYSDRDEISEDGGTRSNPFFKPGWSPEILMSANYLTHLCVMRAECLRDVGGWRSETDGAQDWDLFLRVTRKHGRVRHIPKILYHWRQAASSTAATGLDGKPYAREAQVRTVEAYCRNAKLRHAIAFVDGNPKILWRLHELPRVTIIVLARSVGEGTAAKAKWISRRPECEAAEIICPTASVPSRSGEGVRFVPVSAGAGILDQVNQLVNSATGEVLVFIDAGIELEASAWLREIVGPLSLPRVGLCACHLVSARTGTVGHVGVAFDDEGNASHVRPQRARPQFLVEWDQWLRNWSAASGACFAIHRGTWDEVGGFSGPNGHSRPDIRLCLKLAKHGLRVVTNPAARVRQEGTAALELPLGSRQEQDRRIVRGLFPQGDPHINPNLRLHQGMLVPR